MGETSAISTTFGVRMNDVSNTSKCVISWMTVEIIVIRKDAGITWNARTF